MLFYEKTSQVERMPRAGNAVDLQEILRREQRLGSEKCYSIRRPLKWSESHVRATPTIYKLSSEENRRWTNSASLEAR